MEAVSFGFSAGVPGAVKVMTTYDNSVRPQQNNPAPELRESPFATMKVPSILNLGRRAGAQDKQTSPDVNAIDRETKQKAFEESDQKLDAAKNAEREAKKTQPGPGKDKLVEARYQFAVAAMDFGAVLGPEEVVKTIRRGGEVEFRKPIVLQDAATELARAQKQLAEIRKTANFHDRELTAEEQKSMKFLPQISEAQVRAGALLIDAAEKSPGARTYGNLAERGKKALYEGAEEMSRAGSTGSFVLTAGGELRFDAAKRPEVFSSGAFYTPMSKVITYANDVLSLQSKPGMEKDVAFVKELEGAGYLKLEGGKAKDTGRVLGIGALPDKSGK